jgi:MFS family permease
MSESDAKQNPTGVEVKEDAAETERKAWRNVWLLGGTSFFADWSSDMTYALRAILVKNVLGAPAWAVGVIEGVADSLASAVKVFSGALSDWLGRRKEPTIAGYSGSVVGKFIIFVAGRLLSWPVVFVGQVLDRIGKGVRGAPRDALIADGIPRERRGRAFGIQRTLDHIGAVTGALTCYLILTQLAIKDEQLHRVFLYAVLPGIIGVLLLFFVKEIHKPQKAKPTGTGAGEAATPGLYQRWLSLDRRLRVFLVIVFLFSLANFSNQFMLLKLKDLGYNTPKVVLHYALYNLLAASLAYAAGRLSDLLGRKCILVGGYLSYGVVYLGLAFVGKDAWTYVLFGAYGFYLAMTEGVESALVSDLAPAHARATALGLYGTLVGAGILPASLAAGLLYSWDPRIPFVLGGALAVAAGIALWFFLDMKGPSREAET